MKQRSHSAWVLVMRDEIQIEQFLKKKAILQLLVVVREEMSCREEMNALFCF